MVGSCNPTNLGDLLRSLCSYRGVRLHVLVGADIRRAFCQATVMDEKNAVWVCAPCNSSKGARRFYEYWTARGGLKAAGGRRAASCAGRIFQWRLGSALIARELKVRGRQRRTHGSYSVHPSEQIVHQEMIPQGILAVTNQRIWCPPVFADEGLSLALMDSVSARVSMKRFLKKKLDWLYIRFVSGAAKFQVREASTVADMISNAKRLANLMPARSQDTTDYSGTGWGRNPFVIQREVVRQEVVKEIVRIPCKYCGQLYDQVSGNCPHYGAARPA